MYFENNNYKKEDEFVAQCAICSNTIRADTEEELSKIINEKHWVIDSVLNGTVCEICKNRELGKILQSIIQKSSKPEPWIAIGNMAKISNLYGGYLHGTHHLPNSYDIEYGAYAGDINRFIFSIRPAFSMRAIKVICVAGENNKWYIKNATYRYGNEDQTDLRDMCDILYSALKDNGVKVEVVNYSTENSRQLELFGEADRI